MRVSRLVMCFALLLSVGAARAQAFPMLQLDIVGGYYDPVTETIVSSGPNFTLVALLTPQNDTDATELAALLADTYYISAAINPPQGEPGGTLGSFTFNTVNYSVTADLEYGTPPIEAVSGGDDDVPPSGDLQTHSVFPTYFTEFPFQFSATQTANSYDTAENPGGFTASPTGGSYYQTFNVTTSLTNPNDAIHFDLYNTVIAQCKNQNPCALDEDIALNAPFSHDAQSGPPRSVPEPQTLMVMSTGLLLAGRLLSRRRRA